MSDEIIASVPLGLVVGSGILILLVGYFCGWQIARWQHKQKDRQAKLAESGYAGAILQALPHPALLVNAQGAILTQNAGSLQVLAEFGAPNGAVGEAAGSLPGDVPGGTPPGLPPEIAQAVSRTLASGNVETQELAVPGAPNHRLQVQVTPLAIGDTPSEALVQFIEPRSASGLTDFSQHLTRTLAHELRTPLTAILGHVEVLNSCKIDEEALWRRSLGFVSSETERLARLVEDILKLSRLERVPLDVQPINLRLAAEEALSALYDDAEKKQCTLVLQAPNNLPRALADPDRIRQVLLNLLDNAIKYAPGSTITLRLAVENEGATVTVQDTGAGIAMEDLPHIFEPFYRRGQTAMSARGAGLGLTIVHTILEQHNAQIRVLSHPGDGTAFTFSLPLAATGEPSPA